MPGNVFLAAGVTGLPLDSVVDVTALVTLVKEDLHEQVTVLPFAAVREIDSGLRRVLAL